MYCHPGAPEVADEPAHAGRAHHLVEPHKQMDSRYMGVRGLGFLYSFRIL